MQKIPDEDDTFLRSFLKSSYDYVLLMAGLKTMPMIETQDADGNTVMQWDDSYKTAVFARALCLLEERSWPRPGTLEAVDKLILTLIAGKRDLTARTVVTQATETQAEAN